MKNKMKEKEPSYYMIIPATVWNSDIKDKAKLIYGHITVLANQKGYCWATNSHLAKAVGVKNKETVSGYISDLKELGVITTQVILKKGTKQVEERRIYLATPINQEINSINPEVNRPVNLKVNRPVNLEVTGNTTSNNNINNNTILEDDIKGKIFFKIVELYPANRIGNRQHGLKKFKLLTKDNAKLAATNLKRYLKLSEGFHKSLQNYIEEECYSEDWLKAEETKNDKQNKDKNNVTNAKSFTDKNRGFYD